MSEHLEYSFSKHFAFEAYQTLVEGGSIPDLQNSLTNGSLCKKYVKNFISFVSVSSPATSIIRTLRDKRFTLYDQLGNVGGTLGLVTGMSLLSIVEVVLFALVLLKSIMCQLIRCSRNPTSIMSFFTSKKDKKKACGNEEQMACASHKECRMQLNDINVSKWECYSFFYFATQFYFVHYFLGPSMCRLLSECK